MPLVVVFCRVGMPVSVVVATVYGLAAVGGDGRDLQDDRFIAGPGEVLLPGWMGKDAAGGQGLQLAGVIGFAKAHLQGAADDSDEEVAFLGAMRLQFLVGRDLDAQGADVVMVVGIEHDLAGGQVNLFRRQCLVGGRLAVSGSVSGVGVVGTGGQGEGGQGSSGHQQGGDVASTVGCHDVVLLKMNQWLPPRQRGQQGGQYRAGLVCGGAWWRDPNEMLDQVRLIFIDIYLVGVAVLAFLVPLVTARLTGGWGIYPG